MVAGAAQATGTSLQRSSGAVVSPRMKERAKKGSTATLFCDKAFDSTRNGHVKPLRSPRPQRSGAHRRTRVFAWYRWGEARLVRQQPVRPRAVSFRLIMAGGLAVLSVYANSRRAHSYPKEYCRPHSPGACRLRGKNEERASSCGMMTEDTLTRHFQSLGHCLLISRFMVRVHEGALIEKPLLHLRQGL